MSFPRDLDELSSNELLSELLRREALLAQGRCTYCGRPHTETPCRFPVRHGGPTAQSEAAGSGAPLASPPTLTEEEYTCLYDAVNTHDKSLLFATENQMQALRNRVLGLATAICSSREIYRQIPPCGDELSWREQFRLLSEAVRVRAGAILHEKLVRTTDGVIRAAQVIVYTRGLSKSHRARKDEVSSPETTEPLTETPPIEAPAALPAPMAPLTDKEHAALAEAVDTHEQELGIPHTGLERDGLRLKVLDVATRLCASRPLPVDPPLRSKGDREQDSLHCLYDAVIARTRVTDPLRLDLALSEVLRAARQLVKVRREIPPLTSPQ